MDREQPLLDESSNFSAENNLDCAGDSQQLGSQSKFKDVESLHKAYLNLQSEFTRKCQRLSELEKENSKKENLEPFYQKPEWNSYVKEFLNKHNEAKNYASEIMEILVQDKVLASMPNSLELAFNKILASKYRSEDELVQDEKFIEKYILNNKKIKEKIIADYINEIKTNKSPQVINTSKTFSVGLTPTEKPTSLFEAGEIAKKLFKK